MKQLKWIALGGLLIACSTLWAAEAVAIKSDKDKLSYSIGASIGKNLKSESAEVDLPMLIEGIKASLGTDKVLLSEKEIRQVMNDYQTKLRQRAQVKKQLAIGDNKKKGDAYLTNYKAQKGVQALPNGVLYKVLHEGQGKKPMESDMVEVNYRGALTNGTEFDATEPGKPANLKVSSLIVGWKQALSVMPVGSKWQIVIPAELAYGERGVGNDIGPNEVLVFDLELLAIK
ncbi:MAG: FKBP-type peptidyl-prolyl cis-trans isomerase [Rhodoferax sp.]|uniref:FKBP-type peptidyl-prolyl cis-trans isomerase n=1 Tax=Rhodoferax sp. TaxID=50421 RepID=UPI003017C7C9